MVKKAQYWAYYNIRNNKFIEDIWEILEKEVPHYYQKEMNPHVTVHPLFQSKDGEYNKFKHYVHECFPTTINATITDFYYHPREYQPLVICFDVQVGIDFESRQSQLTNKIQKNGGRNIDDPKPPHITLFSTNKWNKNSRRIPTNVNDIRTRCKKYSEKNLPITINNLQLTIEKRI